MIRDSLGDRMKHNYEEVSKTRLIRRTPVIIRIDGKAFHTFTRGMKKPFDNILVNSMQETMQYLCKNIQGCVLGYTQSDEITLVLVDYQTIDSDAWFDYEVQKMTSVAASLATLGFNRAFEKNVHQYMCLGGFEPQDIQIQAQNRKYEDTLRKAVSKGALFDARVFNIPKEEVTNCVFWRQLDAERNSIQSVGQANYSQKQLNGKSCKDIITMLEEEKHIVWGNLPTTLKRGSCCIKDSTGEWIIDNDIPKFKEDGRAYIERLINFNED